MCYLHPDIEAIVYTRGICNIILYFSTGTLIKFIRDFGVISNTCHSFFHILLIYLVSVLYKRLINDITFFFICECKTLIQQQALFYDSLILFLIIFIYFLSVQANCVKGINVSNKMILKNIHLFSMGYK